MAKNVVIDHDILGWGKSKLMELSKTYEKNEFVGSAQIPRRQPDNVVALYCKEHDCDLLTGDGEAYTHFFKAGIKKVQISIYEWYEKGDKPIYIVRIVE
ncbi:MAG: hypothetical protein ACREBU_05980 [Nitrososphaera sp.]